MVPLYPQYSSSTTGSVFDTIGQAFRKMRNIPNIRFLRSFHDHPAYIDACAAIIEQFWRENGFPSKLILSFHGVPKFSLLAGDPYHCECHKTARLIAEKLDFDDTKIAESISEILSHPHLYYPYPPCLYWFLYFELHLSLLVDLKIIALVNSVLLH